MVARNTAAFGRLTSDESNYRLIINIDGHPDSESRPENRDSTPIIGDLTIFCHPKDGVPREQMTLASV